MSMNEFKYILDKFDTSEFDIEHETKMVQSRILSPILETIDNKKINQLELEKLTGISQSFISSLFNLKKGLNMEHIAKLQNALGIVLQTPEILDKNEHANKYYNKENFLSEDKQETKLLESISSGLRMYNSNLKSAFINMDLPVLKDQVIPETYVNTPKPRRKSTIKKWKKISSTTI